MYGVRPAVKQQPWLTRVVLGVGAGGLFLALWVLLIGTSPANAAPSASPGDAVTLSFTASIKSGSIPGDVLFWLCADAQPDGTGCHPMTSQSSGIFTYQLAAATGTTFHRLEIDWTHGAQSVASAAAPATTPTAATPSPTAQPSTNPLPALPLHTICPYSGITVTGPKSFTCMVDANLFTTTPTPGTLSPTPTDAPTNSTSPPVDKDTGTLITGLQIVIAVGLVLLVILVIVLIWQRMAQRR
jgi:hypothetical protein